LRWLLRSARNDAAQIIVIGITSMPHDEPWSRHERDRWLRHDAHLWIRHDIKRFLKPGTDPPT
jgi:hypothetical protein